MDVYSKPFNLNLDIYPILIWSFGQAYMVSVFPVYLLAPWHISLQLCQLEEKNQIKPLQNWTSAVEE